MVNYFSDNKVISFFQVYIWCLSRRWSDFTTKSVIFVVMVPWIMISIYTDIFINKKKMKMKSNYTYPFIKKNKTASSSPSFVDIFWELFWLYLWCFHRRWSDLAMYFVIVVTATLDMILFCTDLLRKKKRWSCFFNVYAFGIYWVSLWCFATCWFEFSMYVTFGGLVTSKMELFCIQLFRREKKRRVERGLLETMRGVLSNRIDKGKLKAGDHIYSWRHGWIYAHHGVYGEEGKVIHLTRGGGQKFGTGTVLDSSPFHSKDNPMNPCPTCGVQLNRGGVRVISSCMDCFLSGGNLYLFHYGVSVAFFLAKLRGGTCTLAPSDPPEKVLDRAKSLLSKDRNTKIRNGFADYDLIQNNCEDFAIYCKTGPRVCYDIRPDMHCKTGPRVCRTMRVCSSGQAVSLLAATVFVLCSLSLGFHGAIMGFGFYLFERIDFDVGKRIEWDKQVLCKRFVSPSVL